MYLLKNFHQFLEIFVHNTGQQMFFINFVVEKLLHIQYRVNKPHLGIAHQVLTLPLEMVT